MRPRYDRTGALIRRRRVLSIRRGHSEKAAVSKPGRGLSPANDRAGLKSPDLGETNFCYGSP